MIGKNIGILSEFRFLLKGRNLNPIVFTIVWIIGHFYDFYRLAGLVPDAPECLPCRYLGFRKHYLGGISWCLSQRLRGVSMGNPGCLLGTTQGCLHLASLGALYRIIRGEPGQGRTSGAIWIWNRCCQWQATIDERGDLLQCRRLHQCPARREGTGRNERQLEVHRRMPFPSRQCNFEKIASTIRYTRRWVSRIRLLQITKGLDAKRKRMPSLLNLYSLII